MSSSSYNIGKYFGKCSPVHVTCEDQTIDLDTLGITQEQLDVLYKLINNYESQTKYTYTKEEKETLEYLDQYLDIPLVSAVLQKTYKRFHQMVTQEYTNIPPCYFKDEMIHNEMIKANHVKLMPLILPHLLERSSRHYQVPVSWATKYNSMDCLEFLRLNGLIMYARHQDALDCGNLLMLKYFYKHFGAPICHMNLHYALKKGYIDCILFIQSQGHPVGDVLDSTDLELFKLLFPEGRGVNEQILTKVASAGNTHILEYLYHIAEAALRGHLDIVKYAHEQKCPWNSNVLVNAARANRIDIMKYAFDNGCPWTSRVYVAAALGLNNGACGECGPSSYRSSQPHYDKKRVRCAPEYHYLVFRKCTPGNLELVKSAHEYGCPWNHKAIRAAARYGSLDIIKYEHENGCPWHYTAINAAAKHGHVDCINYMLTRGCPIRINEAIAIATTYHQDRVLEYLTKKLSE